MNDNSLTRLAVVFAALLFLSSCCHAQGLLLNGGFETGPTGNVDGNGYASLGSGDTSMTGWVTFGNPIAWGMNGNADGLTASAGNHFLDLTGYGSGAPFGGVLQTVSLTSGQTYRLSFDVGSNQDNGSLAGPVQVTATAGIESGIFTHNPVGSGNQWATYSLDFTASSTSEPISLSGFSGNHYIGLDNVTLTVVPEPTTAGLLCAGLATMAWRRRRRVS